MSVQFTWCSAVSVRRWCISRRNFITYRYNYKLQMASSVILKPPFTLVSATQKVLAAQNLWNTKDPVKVAGAYTSNSKWRNREEIFEGRDAIIDFLTRKWQKELDYKLEKTLFCFQDNKIAVHFQYEYHNGMGHWFRAYGNEHWTFNKDGLMEQRDMSCNDIPILASQRKFK